jgi:hypothetical protein
MSVGWLICRLSNVPNTDVFAAACNLERLQDSFVNDLTLILGYYAIRKSKWDLDLRSTQKFIVESYVM